MKILLLLLLLLYNDPMREVEDIKLTIPTPQHEIFVEYENDNFSQKLSVRNQVVTAEISSINYLDLDFHFRVIPDHQVLSALLPDIKETALSLMGNDHSLKEFLSNVKSYMKDNIRYSDDLLPQDGKSVFLNKRGNCVGFANAAKIFLDAAGVKNRQVKGFYLKIEEGDFLDPIPHRWMEIVLPNGVKFFYDPQYQEFSARYITTRSDVDFKQVRKFKINLLKKSKKIVN
jgi:transglutaminase-like putative cysteine protease